MFWSDAEQCSIDLCSREKLKAIKAAAINRHFCLRDTRPKTCVLHRVVDMHGLDEMSTGTSTVGGDQVCFIFLRFEHADNN
jgi:hypothetical protein